jgi:hypothetical protein
MRRMKMRMRMRTRMRMRMRMRMPCHVWRSGGRCLSDVWCQMWWSGGSDRTAHGGGLAAHGGGLVAGDLLLRQRTMSMSRLLAAS